MKIDRAAYARLYGPTTGDRLRLADTNLVVEIESDFAVYGDEITFGGGKVIRDGMGQHPTATRDEGVLDTVITNAVVIDASGIYKADVGLRDGRIAGIGKAGNPWLQDGVTPGMIVGASTEAIAGEGRPLLDPRTGVYRFDELAVLRSSTIPAVLLEAGVIVNRQEEQKVSTDIFRRKVAGAIASAVNAICALRAGG